MMVVGKSCSYSIWMFLSLFQQKILAEDEKLPRNIWYLICHLGWKGPTVCAEMIVFDFSQTVKANLQCFVICLFFTIPASGMSEPSNVANQLNYFCTFETTVKYSTLVWVLRWKCHFRTSLLDRGGAKYYYILMLGMVAKNVFFSRKPRWNINYN